MDSMLLKQGIQFSIFIINICLFHVVFILISSTAAYLECKCVFSISIRPVHKLVFKWIKLCNFKFPRNFISERIDIILCQWFGKLHVKPASGRTSKVNYNAGAYLGGGFGGPGPPGSPKGRQKERKKERKRKREGRKEKKEEKRKKRR